MASKGYYLRKGEKWATASPSQGLIRGVLSGEEENANGNDLEGRRNGIREGEYEQDIDLEKKMKGMNWREGEKE